MKYLNGLYIKNPKATAPDFIIGCISINRNKLIDELQKHNEEWINLDIKKARNGELYAQINDWKPEKTYKPESEEPEELEDDLPF